jgi:hypothetical protein
MCIYERGDGIEDELSGEETETVGSDNEEALQLNTHCILQQMDRILEIIA